MSRRAFLAAFGALLAGLALLGLLPSRWLVGLAPYRAWVAPRLARALRGLTGGPGRFGLDANVPAWELPIGRDAAVAKLTGGLRAFRVSALLGDPAALHAHLLDRQRADLDLDRLFWIDGWLLTETEVCVLALVGRPPA